MQKDKMELLGPGSKGTVKWRVILMNANEFEKNKILFIFLNFYLHKTQTIYMYNYKLSVDKITCECWIKQEIHWLNSAIYEHFQQ